MSHKKWTIKELLAVTAEYLKSKDIDSSRLAAEVLLAHALHMDRISLYMNFDKPLSESEVSRYRSLVRRRVQREPIQYIVGIQEFWSLEFIVDQRVLIPRPETELLVEHTIKLAHEYHSQHEGDLYVLDLGTGSGAIAVALATELSAARIWATDISHEALQVAKVNAKNHGVLDKINFVQGDLWKAIEDQSIKFHIIVSNPPYVASSEYKNLALEVKDYEPKIALEAGPDGMVFLEKIINHAHEYMRPHGWLLLEMAPWQIEAAMDMINESQNYGKVKAKKDYSGKERIVITQKS